MSTPDKFVVQSRHGPRTWTRTSRGTGAATSPRLDSWQSACLICGRPFEIGVRRNATPRTTRAFGHISCPSHRLTAAEVGRPMRSRDDWRAAFEAIRKAKLEPRHASCQAIWLPRI
jgi:hypothetical protein